MNGLLVPLVTPEQMSSMLGYVNTPEAAWMACEGSPPLTVAGECVTTAFCGYA
jgi:hypothetical protein